MSTILIKAAQLILSLSILVIIHEFGHFTFARLFKTRVEKFYLFFDPWFSIWKHKKGDTEYGIGWLPLGGYVKIAGMIDESMDKEQLAKPPQPWEFRSKPAWQRLLIMVGGVVFNFILAMIIYSCMMFVWGDTYTPIANLKDGVTCSSVAQKIGFQNGDHLIAIDDKPIVRFERVMMNLLLDHPKSVTVSRNGVEQTILINSEDLNSILSSRANHLFYPRVRTLAVDSVLPNTPAQLAGIQKGDIIKSFNGQELTFRDQLTTALQTDQVSTANLIVDRSGQDVNLAVQLDSTKLLGIAYVPILDTLSVTDHYGFFASIPVGVNKGVSGVVSYVKQLRLMFVAKGVAKDVGGFLSIGKIFPATWIWEQFWALTAFLSVVLGVMNILPIPALDGGHVMFVLYEMITRKKPNEKVLEYATIVGMVLLVGLLLFANGNDIYKLFQK